MTQRGTSRAEALRQLERKAPDMLTRVQAGELSPHAAMVKAGLRERTISVRPDNPESTFRTLQVNSDPAALRRLTELLAQECL